MKLKKRLDVRVAELHPSLSRNQIQALILRGKVSVDDKVVTKAGAQVGDSVSIAVDISAERFVSRAGYKLEHALDSFKIDVTGLVALDAGISTGGFTDCLLQRGAKRVYGVDVGYGQVHEKIRTDERVVLLERTNLRYLTSLSEPVDLVTLDLSFISLLKVMPAVVNLIKPNACIITLIKPQFEAARADIKRGGVVKDEAVYQRVIGKVKSGMEDFGFECSGVIESPIRGAKSGNTEFLAVFHKAA